MSANQIHDITSPYLHRHLYHSDMWHRSDRGALRVHPGLAGIHAGIYHNAISVASNSQLPFMFSWSVVHCMPGTVCSAQCSMHHSDREVPSSGAWPGCCRIPASQSIPGQTATLQRAAIALLGGDYQQIDAVAHVDGSAQQNFGNSRDPFTNMDRVQS